MVMVSAFGGGSVESKPEKTPFATRHRRTRPCWAGALCVWYLQTIKQMGIITNYFRVGDTASTPLVRGTELIPVAYTLRYIIHYSQCCSGCSE